MEQMQKAKMVESFGKRRHRNISQAKVIAGKEIPIRERSVEERDQHAESPFSFLNNRNIGRSN